MKKMNVQRLLSSLFLFLTIGVVLFIGLSNNDIGDLMEALRNLTPGFSLLCLLSWLLYVFFDALAIYRFLSSQGHPVKLRHALHASIVGIYYCNITPGSSGGQPMEMYKLSKHGVPIGISGSGMAIKFIVFQAVLLVTGAVLWITNRSFVQEHATGNMWFILLGYLANFFSIGMVLLMAINQKAMRWLIERCIRIGGKLRICKDPEASRAKWEGTCQIFLDSVKQILSTPKELMLQCLIAFCQLMSLMLAVLAVYHALGLQGVSTVQLITMGVLLYIGASYVPSPGASGAQEGGFAVLFQSIFPGSTLFVALLIWRFTTYYLTILVGAVVTVVENVHNLKAEKAQSTEEPPTQE